MQIKDLSEIHEQITNMFPWPETKMIGINTGFQKTRLIFLMKMVTWPV